MYCRARGDNLSPLVSTHPLANTPVAASRPSWVRQRESTRPYPSFLILILIPRGILGFPPSASQSRHELPEDGRAVCRLVRKQAFAEADPAVTTPCGSNSYTHWALLGPLRSWRTIVGSVSGVPSGSAAAFRQLSVCIAAAPDPEGAPGRYRPARRSASRPARNWSTPCCSMSSSVSRSTPAAPPVAAHSPPCFRQNVTSALSCTPSSVLRTPRSPSRLRSISAIRPYTSGLCPTRSSSRSGPGCCLLPSP